MLFAEFYLAAKLRIRLEVSVVRTAAVTDLYPVLMENSEGKIPLERVIRKWDNNIKMTFK